METKYELSEDFAIEMDKEDPIAKFKDRFYINENEIYMDGNSLGLMSKDAESSLLRVIEEWKKLAINGWSKAQIPWIYFSRQLAKLMAPLVGAEEDEIIIHSSTTVNIHSLISTFYKLDSKRNRILVDDLNFPTDRYVIESQLLIRNLKPEEHLVVVESKDGRTLDENEIISKMADDIALVFLPSVLYRSGQLLDMELLTKEAHKRGIYIGFDCCHSAGVVPHKLSQWGVDFAVWCNYKYLNVGPGGPATMYINRKHFDKNPGMAGWMGYVPEKMFDLLNNFEPSKDAAGWQMGTPHILSMAPLEGSLKMYNEVGIEKIREKSLKLTEYMMYLIDNKLSQYGFIIGNPREDHRRGGHVALEHEDAVRINEALKEMGVIPDFRQPNVIRLAPAPLYVSYHDIWLVVDKIKEIMDKKVYEKYENKSSIIS